MYVDTGNKSNLCTVQNWSKIYNIPLTCVKIDYAFDGDSKKLSDFLKLFKDQDEILKIMS